jgi:hypothetical protein
MRKQMKLKKFGATNNDTNEEDNTNVSDAGDVSETFDEENDGSDDATSDNNNDDNDDETFDDNNDDTDDEQDYDTDDQESDDEESDDEEADDEDNDAWESRHAEDLYYNPKSQAWEHSDEDN